MQGVLARVAPFPDQLAGVLVHRNERGSVGHGQVQVPLVHAVGGEQEDQVAGAHRGRGGQVVREDPQLLDHVVHPDDVRVLFLPVFLVLEGTVVLPVQKPLHVGADQLGPVADVVDPVPVHERGGADPLFRPVVDPARGELVVRGLPHDLPGGFLQADDHSFVACDAGPVMGFVVGADEDSSLGDHGIAVGLGPQRRLPTDVLPGGDAPLMGHALFIRDHIPVRSSAPHLPVPRVDLRVTRRGKNRRGQQD